jgi:hypothetical protein
MTASRISQRAVGIGMLLITVGFYWLIAKACDLASPRLKWFVIPAMLAMALLVFARSFTRDVKKYVDATHAYAHRDIDTAELPITFRFITHDITLQQVIDQLGPASRVVDLALRHRDGDTEHFKGHEYDLPYGAAVVVMPQRPFEPEDKIRAVYMRKAPADDWLSVES